MRSPARIFLKGGRGDLSEDAHPEICRVKGDILTLRSSFVFWLTEAVFITKKERSGVKLPALMSGGCKALSGAFISTLREVPMAGSTEP